jgi:hypothetical protein
MACGSQTFDRSPREVRKRVFRFWHLADPLASPVNGHIGAHDHFFTRAGLSFFRNVARLITNVWRFTEFCRLLLVLSSQAPRLTRRLFEPTCAGLISAKES